MKFSIKSIAAATVAALALASCNNEFDDNNSSATYPADVELGAWQREYTPDGEESYNVNITLNEQGDTILDFTYYNPKTGNANVFAGGKVTYNRQVGQITAQYDDSPYNLPARVTLTFMNDLKHAVVNVYTLTDETTLSEYTHFTAVQSDTISVLGTWKLNNGDNVKLKANGTGELVDDSNETIEEGTYTFNQATRTGTFTTASGTVYTLAVNAQGQMNVTLNGTTYYAAHSAEPLPNDWTEVAVGDYTSWIFGQSIGEYNIIYSAARGEYAIADIFGITDNNLVFYWNRNTDEMSYKKGTTFDADYTYPNYGPIWGVAPEGAANVPTYNEEKKTITFPMTYQIPSAGVTFYADDAGTTTIGADKFVISDLIEE